jgi:uncharacterized membrane protein YkoI
MTGNNKFIFGAIAGATALVAAVPFIAQMSMAASGGTTPTSTVQQSDTDTEVPDAQEAAANAAKAKVTSDAAAQTALKAQPGNVKGNTLDDEDGTLAYKVEISNAGKDYDVFVDAINGTVLRSEEDAKDASGRDDAQEADEHDADVKDAPGQDDANEAKEAPGQDDQNEQDEGTQTSSSVSSAQ